MTVRLTVQRAAWQDHIDAATAAYGSGLMPVVKGNGYGFGRPVLHGIVEGVADTVCVGTVHELHDVPAALAAVVLTPVLTPVLAPELTATLAGRPPTVLTIGHLAHLQALAGWHGQVTVKLASSMRRYGAQPTELPELLAAASTAGLTTVSFSLHLPLAGDDVARLAEIEAWLVQLPALAPLWVSHLSPSSFATLRAAHPDRSFAIRVGTGLWHGVPRGSFAHLTADVLQCHSVRAGETAGYFHSVVPCDGTLVVVGGGSTHGIALLEGPDPARSSPLHFARQRMALLERPHMHTTLAVVPRGQPCPRVGDQVDVQRPLIDTTIDELRWT